MIALRWNTFARSLLFALAAAGAALPWWLAARPVLGGSGALCVYLVVVTAAYLAGLTGEHGRGRVAFVIALAAGTVAAVFARSLTELVLFEAMLLAVARSGFLKEIKPARAVVVEVLLTGGGLLFARFLSGAGLASLILVPWGFFLVQSLYFLIGGLGAHGRPARARCDPFEAAHARALALLERSGI